MRVVCSRLEVVNRNNPIHFNPSLYRAYNTARSPMPDSHNRRSSIPLFNAKEIKYLEYGCWKSRLCRLWDYLARGLVRHARCWSGSFRKIPHNGMRHFGWLSIRKVVLSWVRNICCLGFSSGYVYSMYGMSIWSLWKPMREWESSRNSVDTS